MNSGRSLTGDVDINNDGNTYVDLSNGVYPLGIYQGFGRIELDNVLYFSGVSPSQFQLWLNSNINLDTGEDYDVSFMATGNGIVRVNMGYRDPAGSVASAYVTVNDIDLYVGVNYLNGSTAWAGNYQTKRDSRNNNEGVPYPVSTGDTIYIKVRGQNVPVGTQNVALVVTGPFDRTSATQLSAGVFTVPVMAEFSPNTDSPKDNKSLITGVVVGIIVALCIAAVIWYFVVYVPNNRRRAAAAKQRYDQQHGGGTGTHGAFVGVPVNPQPVMGVPLAQTGGNGYPIQQPPSPPGVG
jgi:hypothetical protein